MPSLPIVENPIYVPNLWRRLPDPLHDLRISGAVVRKLQAMQIDQRRQERN